jgi:predicted nuclease of predicted toxin-antitoxin system
VAKYLIDANLPYYFSLWSGDDYKHVSDLGDSWLDSQIWLYAKEHKLCIVTKDADFATRVILEDDPVHVIHIRLGNMTMRAFHQTISNVWTDICLLSDFHRLVRVYEDRIEAIV